MCIEGTHYLKECKIRRVLSLEYVFHSIYLCAFILNQIFPFGAGAFSQCSLLSQSTRKDPGHLCLSCEEQLKVQGCPAIQRWQFTQNSGLQEKRCEQQERQFTGSRGLQISKSATSRTLCSTVDRKRGVSRLTFGTNHVQVRERKSQGHKIDPVLTATWNRNSPFHGSSLVQQLKFCRQTNLC